MVPDLQPQPGRRRHAPADRAGHPQPVGDLEPRRPAAGLVAGDARARRDYAILTADPLEPGEPPGRLAGHRRGRAGRHFRRQPPSADRARHLQPRDAADDPRPRLRPGPRAGAGAPRRRRATRSRASSAAAGRSCAITNADSDVRRLVEIDIATGERRPVSPESRWDVEDYDLSDDGRVLAYAFNEDGFSRVVVQDFVTRRALPQPRDLPRGVLTGARILAGRHAGSRSASPTRPAPATSGPSISPGAAASPAGPSPSSAISIRRGSPSRSWSASSQLRRPVRARLRLSAAQRRRRMRARR